MKKKRSRRPPQRIVRAAGFSIGVTFDTWAKEKRARARAAKLGITVEELLARAIDKRLRKPSKRSRYDLIDLAIEAAVAPTKRRTKR